LADEANFTAINLSKLVRGEPGQHVFGKNDIKKIKVMDQDTVVAALQKIASDSGAHFGTIKIIKLGNLIPSKHDRDDAPNFVRADEE